VKKINDLAKMQVKETDPRHRLKIENGIYFD